MKLSTLFWRIGHTLGYYLLSRHRKGHGIHGPLAYKIISRFIHAREPDTGEIRKKAKPWILEKKITIPSKYGGLMCRLVRGLKPDLIIELGTGTGYSTLYLASTLPDVPFYTVDRSQQRLSRAKAMLKNLSKENVILLHGEFIEFLSRPLPAQTRDVFVFLDGDHHYETVLRYFEKIMEWEIRSLFLLMDDINWNREMYRVFRNMAKDSRIRLSMELNRMGLLILLPGLSKQHYRVIF